jgi:pimeloyl-ACP methyl ester carboxylesterase
MIKPEYLHIRSVVRFVIHWLTILSLTTLVHATPLYPIILVHGFFGSASQWERTTDNMQKLYDWELSRVTHICVNRDPDSTAVSADLCFQFPEPSHVDKSDLFVVSFYNWMEDTTWHLNSLHLPRWSQGHSSAPFKQGAALAQMIPVVLEQTGADKVILLCHSMGGLAAREYLQRRDEAGKPRWWPDSTHHVHQLITIGTPHLGSNLLNLEVLFQQEEALRDMRYSWDSIFSWSPDPLRDHNVYLFGGMESSVPDAYYDRDVDCNGIEGEQRMIEGLNSFLNARPRDNHNMPLPDDVVYSWIVSETLFNSDGVVRTDRQFLPNRGEIITTSRNHTWFKKETGDLPAFMLALDYPDSTLAAPLLKPGQTCDETLWQLEQQLDFDWVQLPPGTRQLLVDSGATSLNTIWLMYHDRTETYKVDSNRQQLIPVNSDNRTIRVCFSGTVLADGWEKTYRFTALP